MEPLGASLTLWSGSDKDSIIKQVVRYVEVAAEIEAELSAVAGDADKFSAFLQKFRCVQYRTSSSRSTSPCLRNSAPPSTRPLLTLSLCQLHQPHQPRTLIALPPIPGAHRPLSIGAGSLTLNPASASSLVADGTHQVVATPSCTWWRGTPSMVRRDPNTLSWCVTRETASITILSLRKVRACELGPREPHHAKPHHATPHHTTPHHTMQRTLSRSTALRFV